MNYKETFFFIAKSLTISFEEKNRDEIERILKTTNIDWELVVKISTSYFVFPAMYCNFKRVNFLKFIPADLVEYMKYITDINRTRNYQILKQVKRLNSLLLKNGIKPIFLKGTGNLLQGLYEDIGERMIGDIDFLFSKKDFLNAINILKKDNYYIPDGELDYFQGFRHYSRLVKKDNIAAVEIHKEVTHEKYRSEFSCDMISSDTQKINDFLLLSFENQFSLSIISSQINDNEFKFAKFSLRNAYDVFLLSKRVDSKKTISRFLKLKTPLNCFLANCNLVFGDLESLAYFKTKESKNYLKMFNKSFNNKESSLTTKFKLNYIKLNRRFNIICRSIFNNVNRKWLIKRIKTKIKK